MHTATHNGKIKQYRDRDKAMRTFHAQQRAGNDEAYKVIPEFCYSATKKEIAEKGYNLVPIHCIEFVPLDECVNGNSIRARSRF